MVPTQVLRKCCSFLLQVLPRGKAGQQQSQISSYSPVKGRVGVCLERRQERLFDESPLHTQATPGTFQTFPHSSPSFRGRCEQLTDRQGSKSLSHPLPTLEVAEVGVKILAGIFGTRL